MWLGGGAVEGSEPCFKSWHIDPALSRSVICLHWGGEGGIINCWAYQNCARFDKKLLGMGIQLHCSSVFFRTLNSDAQCSELSFLGYLMNRSNMLCVHASRLTGGVFD